MKSRLTTVFILFSVLVQTIGLVVNFPWEGIIIWTLLIILLLFAAYFTKYLQRKNTDK